MGRPAPAAEVADKPEVLTETRLDYELRGVFASQGDQLGGAVIDMGRREPGFFQVGDLIAEGITLAAVQDNGVIIDRDGRREKLSLDKSLLQVETFVRARNSHFSLARSEDGVSVSKRAKIGPGCCRKNQKYCAVINWFKRI